MVAATIYSGDNIMDGITQEQYLEELKKTLADKMKYANPRAYFKIIKLYDKLKMLLQANNTKNC